ncbi:MAG: TonB family protein [Proteobacteria bacterium]|nr:TonB family protein [Pseudomonadota bacterium]
MSGGGTRNRRIGSRIIWATLGIALVFHGALLGTSSALGLSFLGGPMVHAGALSTKPDDPALTVELMPTCSGDTYLATVGRTMMCFAPWSSPADRAQCANDVEMSLYMDLSTCAARNEPTPTTVAMVQGAFDKLPQIDPEKLLDEAKQLPPEPPKPPELQPLQPPQPPPPPPPPQPTRPAQIVETAKPATEDPEPENARYLAEYNTKVEKQQVNRGARNEPMVAKAKPEELTPATPKDEPSVKEPPKQDPGKDDRAPPVPGSLAMRRPGAPQVETQAPQEERVRGSSGGVKGPTVADGYMGRKGDGSIEQQRREREEEKLRPRGQDGGGGGSPTPNLKPTKEQLERALGGGNVDKIDDADNGEETALTAKRFVYASFFNRLKRQVAQNWEPASVWRHLDPQGTVYGFKTRITEVRVILAPNGVLDKILVTQASGVSELDDEAVRAFKQAAPFPNPPEGLVKDGRINFAFSFYFEIGQPRSSWKVIRSM